MLITKNNLMLLCTLVFSLVSLSSHTAFANDILAQRSSDEIETLKLRVVLDFVTRESQLADKNGTTLAEKAREIAQRQSSDGSWPDINYSDTSIAGWSPVKHLNRLKVLAAAYSQASLLGDVNRFKASVAQGLSHWYRVSPKSENWWWGDIGKQLRLGPIALMAQKALSDELTANILKDLPLVPHRKGANLTDLSKATIYGGLLSHDHQRVTQGINGIKSTVVVTSEQGIQRDLSYHQHGPQLHNGSYGKVFFSTAIYWAYHARDLSWAFSTEQATLLSSYFLDSDRWMTRGTTIDYSTAGRSISRSVREFSNQAILLKHIDYVAALAPERQADTDAFRVYVKGGSVGLNGHKYFWRADYALSMREDYQFSVHMASNRVATTETGNNENLLGHWLGFGNTFLRLRGNEYRDIFPVWNWKYVPGVTAPEYQGPGGKWGKFLHQSSFVGGVSSGLYGVTAMDMRVMKTRAKKAWFHFDDEIVALGAGISSSHPQHINTTVNQTLLNGDVVVDGKVLEPGHRELTDVDWIHHDNVGYVFPQTWTGYLSNQAQSGSWHKINRKESESEIVKPVLLLRIDHGHQPSDGSYQYIMLPAKTVAQTKAYQADPAISVLENNDNIQSVYHHHLKLTGIVFYRAGTLIIRPGVSVSVDEPSILWLDESHLKPSIRLATPGVQGGTVTVSLTYHNKRIKQLFVMPAAITEMGKSVNHTFTFAKR